MAENVGGSCHPLSPCVCSGELAVSPLSTQLGKLSALATELGDDGSVLTAVQHGSHEQPHGTFEHLKCG